MRLAVMDYPSYEDESFSRHLYRSIGVSTIDSEEPSTDDDLPFFCRKQDEARLSKIVENRVFASSNAQREEKYTVYTPRARRSSAVLNDGFGFFLFQVMPPIFAVFSLILFGLSIVALIENNISLFLPFLGSGVILGSLFITSISTYKHKKRNL